MQLAKIHLICLQSHGTEDRAIYILQVKFPVWSFGTQFENSFPGYH